MLVQWIDGQTINFMKKWIINFHLSLLPYKKNCWPKKKTNLVKKLLRNMLADYFFQRKMQLFSVDHQLCFIHIGGSKKENLFIISLQVTLVPLHFCSWALFMCNKLMRLSLLKSSPSILIQTWKTNWESFQTITPEKIRSSTKFE